MPFILVLSLLASSSADAPHELKWDPRIDLPVAATLGAGWLVTEFVVKKQLAATQCRWCATNEFDNSVRRMFNPSLTPSAQGAAGPDAWSNIIGLGVTPLAMAGIGLLASYDAGEGWLGRWGTDLALIAEATMAAMVFNQAVKFIVARGRPYTVGASAELLASGHDPADQNLSFFSGHTTFAVGLAVSAGVISTMRGYRFAWLTWAVGVPLAMSTILLRLGADKHWASDVMVGMAVSTAFSIGIPVLFHGRLPVKVSPQPNGLSVQGTF